MSLWYVWKEDETYWYKRISPSMLEVYDNQLLTTLMRVWWDAAENSDGSANGSTCRHTSILRSKPNSILTSTIEQEYVFF